MEANKFGFGLDMPPAFKFDPTDADIVAYYLLPRALGLPNPHKHAIKDDDPGKVPPWEILVRHGHRANDDHAVHAFFFCPPTDPSRNGGRKSRTVEGGGVWQGQKGTEETITLLSPGGGEVDVRYKRYNLTFKHLGLCTGYVMHEFEILSPPLPGTVLTRIKAKKGARPPVVNTQHAVLQHPADPEQTGPSYEYDAAANGEEFTGTQDGALYDSNGYDYTPPLQYDIPVCEYDNSHYNATEMMSNREGFTGAQADAFCGGGTAEAAGDYYDPSSYDSPYQQRRYQQDRRNQYQAEDDAVMCSTGGEQQTAALCGNSDTYNNYDYVPECGGEYSNYYGDYQQWRHQQDPSNQYQAGDAAVMCTGGDDGFMGEQQTAALCGDSDKASVTQSTDDITFYNNYDPSNHVPECGGEYSNYYGEYQQRRHQHHPSNQYEAGDAVMSEGSEKQAGPLCGNSDSGSIMETETRTPSTISLCSDEEYKCDDDNTLYDILFGTGDHDDFKCDQNDAGDPANVLV